MRLIDADALIEKADCLFKDLNSFENFMYNHGVGDSIATIKNAPTIEAEPIKHGKWITNEYYYPICSVCGTNYEYEALEVDPTAWNYCPCCGAKMEEE